jgi:hypothetical protein
MDDLPGSGGVARGTLGSQPGGPAGGDSSARWASPCTLREERGCLITIKYLGIRLSFQKIARFGSRKAKISPYQNNFSMKLHGMKSWKFLSLAVLNY